MQQKIQSLGSGFLVDGEGYIVTNEHVVERASRAEDPGDFLRWHRATRPITSPAIRRRISRSSRSTRNRRANRFPYINLKNLSPNLLGQTVLALGNPLGYNSSVSRGILSANDRELTIENNTYKHLIQTDAAINPGNSGGPLIDLAGRLVGINSVKLAFTPQGSRRRASASRSRRGRSPARSPSSARRPTHPQTAKRAPTGGEGTPIARKLFGLDLQASTALAPGSRGTNTGVAVARRRTGQPGGRRRGSNRG